MKHIFTSALLIGKIAVFGVRRTHMRLAKNKCHCLMWILDRIGPYFFENEADQTATVNGTRCGRVLSRFSGDQNWLDHAI